MTGDSDKGKMGKIYNYYKCFTKKKNKDLCDKKSISQEYIENIVLLATKEFLAKKEQPEHRCSDCYHLAERTKFRLNWNHLMI